LPTLDDVKAATVGVQWWESDDDGLLSPTGAGGTGAIVTSDGLILTNAHVGAPTAPGLAALYGLVALPSTPPDALVIAILTAEDIPPEPRYIAEPVVVEGWMDLAVLQIVSDLDGNPVSGLDLPTITLGDSASLSGGDVLTVLGFPGVGGDTLSTTRGIVAGFLPDAKLDVRRGWVKTDTPINPGNSGGVAIDDENLLVGIPTRGSDQIDQLRPLELAKPLIDDAVAGRSYVQHTGAVAATGSEALTFEGWGLDLDDDGTCVIDPVDGYALGTEYLLAGFSYEGFVDGEDVQWVWFVGEEFWYEERLDLENGWTEGADGDCFWFAGYNFDDQPLLAGVYQVLVFAGPEPDLVAEASVEVADQELVDSGTLVQVHGRVVDFDSGQPIPEASAAFLLPGVDPDEWMDDPTGEEIASVGETGPNGEDFEFTSLIDRTLAYPVVAFADGYQIMADCCIEVRDDLSDDVLITFKLVRLAVGG